MPRSLPLPALLLPLACAAVLSACQDRLADSAEASPPAQAEGTPAPASAEKAAADGALAWNASVAWDGDLNACRQGDAAATRDCLLDAMRAGSADAAAVTAAGQLSSGGEPAYVSAWHEHDGIGVATVTYPFRANTNEGTRLIDARGQRIDVDADPLSGETASDPTVQALTSAHPGATAFAPAQAAGSSPLEDGGVRMLYRTPLRDCHACVDVAQVQVGYDFDAQRNFVGRQVVP